MPCKVRIDRRPKYKQVVDAMIDANIKAYLRGDINDFREYTLSRLQCELFLYYGKSRTHLKNMVPAKIYALQRINEVEESEILE